MTSVEIYGVDGRLHSSLKKDSNSRVNYSTVDTLRLIDNIKKLDFKSFCEDDKNLYLSYKDALVSILDANSLLDCKELSGLFSLVCKINQKGKHYKENKINRKHSSRIVKSAVAIGILSLSLGIAAKLVSEGDGEVTVENEDKTSITTMDDNTNDSGIKVDMNTNTVVVDSASSLVIDVPKEDLAPSNMNTDDDELTNDLTFDQVVTDVDNTKEEEQNITPQEDYQDADKTVFFYENKENTDKAIFTRDNYGDVIATYANRYGVDPNLMTAIATQERGEHSTVRDEGGAIGLMQIQVDVWNGQSITGYNYETGEYETVSITEDNLRDLDFNIKVGCMVMQQQLSYCDGDINKAVQCYNIGIGNMQAIGAFDGQDWLSNRAYLSVGDPSYLEHVYSWALKDQKGNICFSCMNPNTLSNVSTVVTNNEAYTRS